MKVHDISPNRRCQTAERFHNLIEAVAMDAVGQLAVLRISQRERSLAKMNVSSLSAYRLKRTERDSVRRN